MRYVAGIDAGTGLTKAVILASEHDARPIIVGRGSAKAGINVDRAAQAALDAAMDSAGLEMIDISYVASTGFGRYGVSTRDIQITEITSAARGAYFLFPETTSVLDIGSQSTRAISLKEGGKVASFKTNDKCAAGSGSFIVRAAKYLQIELSEAGELALQASSPQAISSVCAVLAESEIINHVSAGVGVEDILRGIYDSLAERAMMLLKRAGSMEHVTFIGGVACQRGMVRALEDRLGMKVNVPERSEYVCATGAALLGLKRLDASFRLAQSATEKSISSTAV
ncbi:MAG TPA: acyl-CoA dehydratase activase [Blastocatellia bacterium]|jgi:predicted CoA-substrate-specific enzyme activase